MAYNYAINGVTTVTDAASIQDIFTGTILTVLYPTSIGSPYGIVQKGTSVRWGLRQNTSTIIGAIARATTACQVISSSRYTANQWNYIAFLFDTGGASTDQKLYIGNTPGQLAEPTYSTQTVGSGTVTSNVGQNMTIGNIASISAGFVGGQIGMVAVFNRRLSLDEIVAFFTRPSKLSGLVLWHELGVVGAADLSGNGNNGSNTNVTVADHYPRGALRRIA